MYLKGYFLIIIDKKKLIKIDYCKFKKLGNNHIQDMVSIISGKTAIEIVNTLIKKNIFLPTNMLLIWALSYVKLN